MIGLFYVFVIVIVRVALAYQLSPSYRYYLPYMNWYCKLATCMSLLFTNNYIILCNTVRCSLLDVVYPMQHNLNFGLIIESVDMSVEMARTSIHLASATIQHLYTV